MRREARPDIYAPCSKCGTSGDENFYIGYDDGSGTPVSFNALMPLPANLSKLKVVCKKCGLVRDAV